MPLSRLLRLLAALLLLATALLVGRVALTAWQEVGRAERSLRAVAQLQQALTAAERVSKERGPTNGALGDERPVLPARQQALQEARERTDEAFALVAAWLQGDASTPVRQDAAQRFAAARIALGAARDEVDRTLALPKAERTPDALRAAVYGMVAVVPRLSPVVSMAAGEAQDALPAIGDDVQGARLSAELREYTGLLGSHFTAALARRLPFTPEDRARIERTRGRIDQLRFLLQLRVQVPGQAEAVRRAWDLVEEHYFGAAMALAGQVIEQGEGRGQYTLDPAGFAAAYVPDMNTILGLRDVLLERARQGAADERERALRALTAVAAGAALLLAVLLGSMLTIQRRVLRPLAATARTLKAMARSEPGAELPQPLADDEIAAVIGGVATLQQQTRERQALERERDELIQRLQAQSSTDFLTGLANRRAFFEAAERDLARARRHGLGVVVILLDIDHFKQFNDTWGHDAGDRALRTVADALREQLRQGDLAARFGGEEFVLLLSPCDRASGLRFAERLREVIAQAPVRQSSGDARHVSASLGVAASDDHGLVLELLLSHADRAMYRAKHAGRNRVQLAEATDLVRPQGHVAE